MKQQMMISEQELRNDTDFINSIIAEIPNIKAPKDFTHNVMKKVEQQVPIKIEPWYQSLGLWLILTGIATLFFGFFGFLYYLCDYSVMTMFKVIITFLEKFEMPLPDLSSFFSNISFGNTGIFVILILGVFLLLDLFISTTKKPKKERLYSI